MELRITERLQNGEWLVVRFKDLIVGDIVRLDDLPDKLWRVDESPREVINEANVSTMGFLSTPVTLAHHV